MKKKTIKSLIYRPKKLIAGYMIEAGMDGLYAAIPDRRFKTGSFKIIYTYTVFKEDSEGPTVIMIEKEVESWLKAEKFRRFPDRWGRGIYTLGYFRMCEKL